MDGVIVVSVVRDFAMYETCVVSNPYLDGAVRVTFDNREKNEPIPVLYNRFLDEYGFSRPAWFVFCHEDFQPLEPLGPLLENADVKALWGPVGVRTVWRWGLEPHRQILGRLEQCEKDGGNVRSYGRAVPFGTCAETFDCQCLIAHSSLFATRRLRFDERFPFDLYVEDFCVNAQAKAGIASRILPFACRHWSPGVQGGRYCRAERAFAEKWPNVCVTGTSSETLGGGAGVWRRTMQAVKRLKRRIVALGCEWMHLLRRAARGWFGR